MKSKIETVLAVLALPAIWALGAKTGKGKLFRWLLVLSLYYSPVSLAKSVFRPTEAASINGTHSNISDMGEVFLMQQEGSDIGGYSGKAIVYSTVTDYGSRRLRNTTVMKPSKEYVFSVTCNEQDGEGQLFEKSRQVPITCKFEPNGSQSVLVFSPINAPNGETFGVRFDIRESQAEIEARDASRD